MELTLGREVAMQYKVARTSDDFAKANDCLGSSGYYDPTDLAECGGITMIAVDGEDVVGVVWVAISGRLALLDYLAIRKGYPGLSVRMLVRLRSLLVKAGIKQVRYTIHGKNVEAYKISTVLGGLNDFPYVLGCVNLEAENGK